MTRISNSKIRGLHHRECDNCGKKIAKEMDGRRQRQRFCCEACASRWRERARNTGARGWPLVIRALSTADPDERARLEEEIQALAEDHIRSNALFGPERKGAGMKEGKE